MLCIEIDGNSHEIEAVFENDVKRQKKLEALGIRFIRFNDKDVKKGIQNIIRSLTGMIEQLKTGK